MNLFLLRHGIAVERTGASAEDDFDRPLTPEGRKKTSRAAKAMRALDLDFDFILSSPLLRARQTAAIVAAKYPKASFQLADPLEPGGSPAALLSYLKRLKPQPANLLLVGHEPDLGQLLSLLVSGDTRAAIDFKKGCLCCLSAGHLKAGRCATLQWLLPPAILKRLP